METPENLAREVQKWKQQAIASQSEYKFISAKIKELKKEVAAAEEELQKIQEKKKSIDLNPRIEKVYETIVKEVPVIKEKIVEINLDPFNVVKREEALNQKEKKISDKEKDIKMQGEQLKKDKAIYNKCVENFHQERNEHFAEMDSLKKRAEHAEKHQKIQKVVEEKEVIVERIEIKEVPDKDSVKKDEKIKKLNKDVSDLKDKIESITFRHRIESVKFEREIKRLNDLLILNK